MLTREERRFEASVGAAVDAGLLFADERRIVRGAGEVRTVRRPVAELSPAELFPAGSGGAFLIGPFRPDEPTTCLVPEEFTVTRRIGGSMVVGGGTPLSPGDGVRDVRLVASQSARSWMESVREAASTMRKGEGLQKVVLCRELRVEMDRPVDRRVLFSRLMETFPSTYLFSIGRIVGASPELLVEVVDGQFECRALAGTVPRSVNGPLDARSRALLLDSVKDNYEHQLLREYLAERLDPYIDELAYNAEPDILSLANVHHLMTVYTGRLADGRTLLDVIAAIHPTPAICGAPQRAALDWISAHEPAKRGDLGGFLGWMDAAGNGQLVLTIRCLEVEDTRARIVVGCGLVADSDPEREILELQAKLRGILETVTTL
jgi:menaquinone-specific isochorismate synthase